MFDSVEIFYFLHNLFSFVEKVLFIKQLVTKQAK